MSPGLCPASAWPSGLWEVSVSALAAHRGLFDDGDHVHLDDFTVGESQGHLGATGQRFVFVRVRWPRPQPPVQFVDPVAENNQLIGPLDRLRRVAVVPDHAAVVFDLGLEEFAPLPQPIQLRGEVIPRRIRHRLDFLGHVRRPFAAGPRPQVACAPVGFANYSFIRLQKRELVISEVECPRSGGAVRQPCGGRDIRGRTDSPVRFRYLMHCLYEIYVSKVTFALAFALKNSGAREQAAWTMGCCRRG